MVPRIEATPDRHPAEHSGSRDTCNGKKKRRFLMRFTFTGGLRPFGMGCASLFDHQKGYIDFWLHFVGVEKTHSIVIENTWSDREAETLAKGKSEAIRLVGQL
jgi:FMN-dependent NADH-azoreductase